jgi:nucleotide-binding universal stress UspA family protein
MSSSVETGKTTERGAERKMSPDLSVDPVPIEIKRILVPLDFSPLSKKALEYAIPLAAQFGAKITLLHALEPLPYSAGLGYFPDDAKFPVKAMENDLKALAGLAITPDLLNQVIVRVGVAHEVIINLAADLKIDLIVLTTHGYTGLKHSFIGSTAERVVRHAPCPVFVVRAREHVSQ